MTILSATPDIATVLQRQREFFATGATQPYAFRQAQLLKLKAAIAKHQQAILAAVRADLGRPEFEAYFELSVVNELDYILKHLKRWMRPRRARVPLSQRPGKAWVQADPLGVVLVMGAWNYPISLVLSPLMGAIAAGNCAILKPSELAPASSQVLADLVADTFDPEFVTVVEGGVETAQALLAQRFDHILYTGGGRVGRLVMAAAAQHLTPVTLELGGKSPCIVAADAPVEVTARRILWSKFLNAGQTCIAPDYVLVQADAKPALVAAMQQGLEEFYGGDPAQSPDYSRIINHRQFDRLVGLLEQGTVLTPGQHDREQRYFAPTLLDGVSWEDPVMQEEIFGPILPILTYDTLDQAIAQINQRPKPLALYLFSDDRTLQDQVLAQTSSGSVCLNDVVVQTAIWDMPFGGVGGSGLGAYHGEHSFKTFSHFKSVLRKPFRPDINWRYPPYGATKLKLFKRLLGLS